MNNVVFFFTAKLQDFAKIVNNIFLMKYIASQMTFLEKATVFITRFINSNKIHLKIFLIHSLIIILYYSRYTVQFESNRINH